MFVLSNGVEVLFLKKSVLYSLYLIIKMLALPIKLKLALLLKMLKEDGGETPSR